MSTSSAASDAAVEAIVVEFGLWLARERGLSAAAMCCYGKQARKFLCWLPDRVDSAVRQLDSTQVASFMVSYYQDRNISSTRRPWFFTEGSLSMRTNHAERPWALSNRNLYGVSQFVQGSPAEPGFSSAVQVLDRGRVGSCSGKQC